MGSSPASTSQQDALTTSSSAGTRGLASSATLNPVLPFVSSGVTARRARWGRGAPRPASAPPGKALTRIARRSQRAHVGVTVREAPRRTHGTASRGTLASRASGQSRGAQVRRRSWRSSAPLARAVKAAVRKSGGGRGGPERRSRESLSAFDSRSVSRVRLLRDVVRAAAFRPCKATATPSGMSTLVAAPVFLGDDAIAALAVSLTAAAHATTDAHARRAHDPRHDRAHQPPVAAVLH